MNVAKKVLSNILQLLQKNLRSHFTEIKTQLTISCNSSSICPYHSAQIMHTQCNTCSVNRTDILRSPHQRHYLLDGTVTNTRPQDTTRSLLLVPGCEITSKELSGPSIQAVVVVGTDTWQSPSEDNSARVRSTLELRAEMHRRCSKL